MTTLAPNSKDSRSDLQSHLVGDLLDMLEIGHWASIRQMQIWVRGYATPRYTTIELAVKDPYFRKRVRVTTYTGKKGGTINVYALKTRTKKFNPDNKTSIYHSLASMEGCVRFYRSDLGGDVIPERFFNRLGSKPEWGIRYPSDMILLYEFGTESNVKYHNLIMGKLNAYNKNLKGIENRFFAKGIVLFVLDVPRDVVLRRVTHEWKPKGPYRFVDAKTFFEVPIGKQFDERIYIYPDGTVGGL